MTLPIQPPPVAVWLLRLFSPQEQAESILGDVLEEFRQFAESSGVPFARRWYWRQSLRGTLHLLGFGFRQFWRSVVAVVVGAFFLLRYVGELFEHALFAVLRKYQVADHHFGIYVFFATYGAEIAHLIGMFMVGFVVALVAKRREMVATLTLCLVVCSLAVIASVVMFGKTGNDWLVLRLPWSLADSFTILLAGTIVRTRRLEAAF